MRFLYSLIFVLVFSVPSIGMPEVGKVAPDFVATDSNGNRIELSSLRGKPVILEWTNHLCPYVKKHYKSGNMQSLQRRLTEEGAVWLSIVSSAPGKQGYVLADEANALTTRRGVYADNVLLDPTGAIGRMYDAKTTPQMFLIDEAGIIQYMGAIDDKPSSRASTLKGAKNYLLAAWEAYKAGAEIEHTNTKPYGCTVKYASLDGYK